jgi:negative regulator of flagellin synthesis FlgM
MMDVPGELPKILPFPIRRRVGDAQKTTNSTHAQPTSGGDSVSLSPQARELRSAREALTALPDIREEKVAAIRAQIEAGTYKVDSEKTAAKMIAEALLNDHLK